MNKIRGIICVKGHFWFRCFVKWCGWIFGIWGAFASFISLDELGLKGLCPRVILLMRLLFLALFCSLRHAAFKRSKSFWTQGRASLQACYGDIFKLASKHASKSGSCCRVVPVNAAFDTVVDFPGSCSMPLISPSSLHGIWIAHMANSGVSVDLIDSSIEQALKSVESCSIKDASAGARGKTAEYPIGTVVPIAVNNVTYLLVALTRLDQKNNAYSSKMDLIAALRGILDYHNENGQGCELLLPLMGTGISRMGLTHEDSFDAIVSYLSLHRDKLHGLATVVVYSGDTDKISIWD